MLKDYYSFLNSHQILLICQLMGFFPRDIKMVFVLENGLLLKKPLLADKGLGCTDLRI